MPMKTAEAIAAQEETIKEITCRLVAFYSPVRIYLFGSVARGDFGKSAGKSGKSGQHIQTPFAAEG